MKYGVSPAVLEFYDRILAPLRSQTIDSYKPTIRDISSKYYMEYHQTIGTWNLEHGYLRALEDAGIIHPDANG